MNRRGEACRLSENVAWASRVDRLTTVNAKYLVVDDNREGQKVEHVGKIRPDMR